MLSFLTIRPLLCMTGSLAAGFQSIVYGASTGGLFSVLQSIGATAVLAPPLALGLGVVAFATGTGLAIARSRSGDKTPSNAGEAEKGGGEEGGEDDDEDNEDFNDCGCSSCGTEVPEMSEH
jgi:hypothetical protein